MLKSFPACVVITVGKGMRDDNWGSYMGERRTRVCVVFFAARYMLVTYHLEGSRSTI